MHPTNRWTTPLTLCAALLFSFLAAAAIPAPPLPPDDPRLAPLPEPAWLLQPQPLRHALRAPLTPALAESINRHGGLLLIGLSPQPTLLSFPPCTLSVSLAGFTQHQVVLDSPDQPPEDPTLLSFPLWSDGGDLATPLRQAHVTPTDTLTLLTSDACEGLLLGAVLFLDEAATHAQANPSDYWEGALHILPVAPPTPPPTPDTPPPADALSDHPILWAGF
jgi:hypothetical protein